MDRELKAAGVAVGGASLTLLFAVVCFRVVVPAILESHIEGGTILATVAGFALVGLIVAFTGFWVGLVGLLLQNEPKAENTEEAPPK